MAGVAVAVVASADSARAAALAAQLVLPLVAASDPGKFPLELFYDGDRLALRAGGARGGGVMVDFATLFRRLASVSRRSEMLARAVGASGGSRPSVLDATAGLGRDAAVLAAFGLDVLLVEREPVIAALLADGLRRAHDAADQRLLALAARMHLVAGKDVCQLTVGATLPPVDVITLDPMFPERDKSAAVKKEMQLLQKLLGAEPQSAGLLEWALAQPVARVVVKRPVRAPAVAGPAPSHTVTGRRMRYDVYVKHALTRRP